MYHRLPRIVHTYCVLRQKFYKVEKCPALFLFYSPPTRPPPPCPPCGRAHEAELRAKSASGGFTAAAAAPRGCLRQPQPEAWLRAGKSTLLPAARGGGGGWRENKKHKSGAFIHHFFRIFQDVIELNDKRAYNECNYDIYIWRRL